MGEARKGKGEKREANSDFGLRPTAYGQRSYVPGLALWLLLCLPGLLAQQISIFPDSVISSPPKFLGVEGTWVNEDSALFLERFALLGINTVRIQMPMFKYEPENENAAPYNSEINFNRDFDLDAERGKTIGYHRMLRNLLRRHPDLNVSINIWDCANWLASTRGTFFGGRSGAFPPAYYPEYREWISSIARWLTGDLKVPPQRIMFAFVNEPNARGKYPTTAFKGDVRDLLTMARAAREALDEVSREIRLGGIEEINSSGITERFLKAGGGDYLDFLSFHVYGTGPFQIGNRISGIAAKLAQSGKPVYLTELGDNDYGKDFLIDYRPRDAGVAMASHVMSIWRAPLESFQMFRLSSSYYGSDHAQVAGWKGYGLFEDWRGTHTDGEAYRIHSVFWVLANSFRHLAGGKVVQVRCDLRQVDVLAVWDPSAPAILAAYNLGREKTDLVFRWEGREEQWHRVLVTDALSGIEPSRELPVQQGSFSFAASGRGVVLFRLVR